MGEVRTRREIKKSLLKKGFSNRNGSSHEVFQFQHEDKKQSIGTKLSYGSKKMEHDDYLLGKMSKQLLLTKSQFLDLIDCPLKRKGYIEILRSRRAID